MILQQIELSYWKTLCVNIAINKIMFWFGWVWAESITFVLQDATQVFLEILRSDVPVLALC